jgi:DivIVA domain-containing protein
MPLTPADVHNVAFSKPPIGKRGYNEDEVDAFLDLVEGELARLIEENNDLRQQVEQLDQQLETARADLDDARAKASSSPMTTRMPVEEPRRLAPVPPPSVMEQTSPGGGGDHHVQAAKVLGLAQEMADRLTGEAKAEADGMLSEARAKADTMVNEARTRAETMLNDARTRSETLERQAREKATALDRDAQRKHAEVMGNITQEKNTLEKQIDKLQTFEREYRTRLKTMLESSLRDLQDRGPAAPSEGRSQGYSFGARAEAG